MAKQRTEFIRLSNRSTQTIPIQAKPPGGDFYLHEQQIHLRPGKSVVLPRDHVLNDQIVNLVARGYLRITADASQK